MTEFLDQVFQLKKQDYLSSFKQIQVFIEYESKFVPLLLFFFLIYEDPHFFILSFHLKSKFLYKIT